MIVNDPVVANRRCHRKYDHIIPAVRENLLLFIKENGCDDIYSQDVDDAKSNDYTIRRFLVSNDGKLDQTVNAIVKAFRWYKKMKFRELTDNYFPSELYQTGAMFRYESDKDGRPVVYSRMKIAPRISELIDSIKHYGCYTIWKVDQESKGSGWTMVTDLTDSSLAPFDLELGRFFIMSLRNYFPMGIQYQLCINGSIIWRGVHYIFKDILPQKYRGIVNFISTDKITDYVNIENIPRFLNGKCPRPYNGPSVVPSGCPSGVEYAEKVLGLRKDSFNFQAIIDKIYNSNRLEEIEFSKQDASSSAVSSSK